jgi:3-oxoacyl-[acyl-carrier-protein] synthase I
MTAGESVHVVALGASTPIGRDPWSSAAAVRAGVSGFTQHPVLIDSLGEPVKVSMVPWLDPALAGVERLEALLLPAVDQVLQSEFEVPPSLAVALAIALPSMRPGVADDMAARLLAACRARYGDRFVAMAAFPNGHAAGVLALNAAMRRLMVGAFDAVVLAGADSYMAPETLEWLEQCDQLHGAGPLNNAWGFIPGEAAGALLLIRSTLLSSKVAVEMAQLMSVGIGTESKRIKTDSVCIGEGLTQAFRTATQGLPAGAIVTDVYCDLNGEPYRADEYGFTSVRTREFFRSAGDFVAPADCWGDVAAAGVPLHVALACIAGSKNYSIGDTALVWASSETGERGAAAFRVHRGTHAR